MNYADDVLFGRAELERAFTALGEQARIWHGLAWIRSLLRPAYTTVVSDSGMVQGLEGLDCRGPDQRWVHPNGG